MDDVAFTFAGYDPAMAEPGGPEVFRLCAVAEENRRRRTDLTHTVAALRSTIAQSVVIAWQLNAYASGAEQRLAMAVERAGLARPRERGEDEVDAQEAKLLDDVEDAALNAKEASRGPIRAI
ncbi:hypothetical protein GOY17_08680 [Lysobacter soli]|uniref:hypothetical protein n=1 Tax=Lysobacter soli TaxID=453783 RepID=UPI0012EDF238|nr:hypothetical protein [Lysobacter soli]QGW64984.1 hypothetical protein GOY17_08680 [Lysobacter soli]